MSTSLEVYRVSEVVEYFNLITGIINVFKYMSKIMRDYVYILQHEKVVLRGFFTLADM